MDVKKLVMGMVGIMICAVMIGGSFLSIVSSVTAESDTFKNVGYFDLDKIENEGEVIVEWTPTAPYEVKTNGEVVSLDDVPNFSVNIVLGDNWFVRYWNNQGQTTVTVQTFGLKAPISVNTTTNVESMTITLSNNVATIVAGSESLTYDYTSAYYPVNNGSYTMKDQNKPVYLLGATELDIIGTSVIGGSGGRLCTIDGSISNGFTSDVFYPTTGGYTASNTVGAYSEVDNYVNLYKLDKITFTASKDGTDETVTYSYFVVPSEVTADRTEPMDRTSATLFNVLPIVAVAGLVMAGIYVFISRK